METHEVDLVGAKAMLGQKLASRSQMRLGHRPRRRGEHLGLRLTARPGAGAVGRGLDHRADLLRQLALASGAEGVNDLAVRLQDRHVDGVQRCAAHETQDPHRIASNLTCKRQERSAGP